MTSDVGIFWDFENCRPPKNSSGYEVVNNIRDIAHEYGTVKLLKAYVEPDPLSRAHLRSELQLSGVSLTDCPHNGNKEVADKMIIVDAMLWALENSPSATIVIITGDRDFGYAVSMLRLRRFQVVVISQTQLHAPPTCLTKQASFFYSWEEHVLKTAKPAPPTHNRSKSSPTNVPNVRSDAPPPRTRARAASVAVTSSVSKASTAKQPAGATTFGAAPHISNHSSLSAATAPFQSTSSPPNCKQSTPSKLARTEPPVVQQLPSPSPPVPRDNITRSSQPTNAPPPPSQKFLPPVKIEQLNSTRSLLNPSLLSPLPTIGVRSDVSAIHANGEFCGKPVPSTTTTTPPATVVESPTAIDSSMVAPEHADSCSSSTGNTLPMVDATLLPISETEAVSPSTPTSSTSTTTQDTHVDSDESSTVNGVDASPSGASSLTLGDSPVDDHPVMEMNKPEGSFPLFVEPEMDLDLPPIQEVHLATPPDVIVIGATPGQVVVPQPLLLPVATALPPVVKPTPGNTPAYFYNLIKLLQTYRTEDIYEPLMSKAALEVPDRDNDLQTAGALRFGQFCAMAQECGIIDVGNPGPGREWIRLCPSFYRFSPVVEVTKRMHPRFAVLIEVLLEMRSKGKTKPSRSEVALQIVRRCPRVYQDAGVKKFALYATMAANARVVVLGFPPLGVSGDAWISLHPDYAS